MKSLLAPLCSCFFLIFPAAATLAQSGNGSSPLVLWYDSPATEWMTQALPIGNGHVGTMFFGGVDEERLQFSEGSLWAGGKNANASYDFGLKKGAGRHLVKVRELLAAGKTNEAFELAKKEMTGAIHEKKEHEPSSDFGAQQPAGDLYVRVSHNGAIQNYRRELNISDAVGKVSYDAGGSHFERTFFGNYPSKVMVYQFKSSTPETYSVRFTSPHKKDYEQFEKNQYTFGGSLKDNHQEFETVYRVDTDGKTTFKDGILTISNARSVVLIHTIATDYVMQFPTYKGNDYKKANRATMLKVAGKRFDALYAEQQKDYHALFDRVSLRLGKETVKNLPTNERQKRYSQGQPDAGLEELYFQYGRYLMISSTRPGTMPMSLQGKWNDSTNPPWTNDYHTNINIQMLYWPAEVTNLAECHLPLMDFTKSVVEPGKLAAKEFFNAKGWVVNTMLNAYGYTSPGWDLPWGFFPGGAAWLSQHLWEHYAFTNDKTFLKNTGYPVMKEAAIFWMDYLTDDGSGHLVSSPSFSPEHGGISTGATMDHEIAWDILNNTAEAATVLGIDRDFAQKAAKTRDKILPLQIGRWKQLQEWREDVDDSTNHHRHVSHLFALHPGKQISITKTPAEAEAAKISLNARGDDGTGWSLAWKVNFWARLQDGNRAHKLFKSVLRPVASQGTNMSDGGGSYANLLCAHPPFQLDGNMGSTAGVAEMLLQSQTGVIELLPALPDAWPAGEVKGLKARGNVTVDEIWENGMLKSVSLISPQAQKRTLKYGGKTTEISLTANVRKTILPGNF
ncbi:glycosyl hydrolase family 95 catalytic domain-containing protein [Dyadobacter sp. CY323]|uniref:glycoside hydrolase family 95 protein n=1 Tax=Dyadobacter sp. CY323 TaxID=2907302 RepID=UPI001F4609F7|nr:glycoside hydrolase family 95 protein [Dyadobacter sp. CY323]MCE6991971.1 glycoside hydrolase N-terminal domain-containing protein [Dyadobacter sp. CY323]